MSLDAKGAAALALHRFGLGPRAGSITAIASDPRGALLAELDKPGTGQIVGYGLLTARRRRARRSTSTSSGRRSRSRSAHGRGRAQEHVRGGMAMTPWSRRPKSRRWRRRPAAPQPDPPQQNIFREVKARIDAAMGADDRLRRAAGVVLVEPFLRLGRRREQHGRRLRARGDPHPRARPLRRHAAGGREPSGDAGLSRQFPLDRPEVGRRPDQQDAG